MSFFDELKLWKFRSSKAWALEEVRARYKAFIEQHGELFENKIEELSEEDVKDFFQRRKKFKRIWLVVCVVLGLITLAYILMGKYTFDDTNSLFWFIIVVVGGGFLMMRNYRRTLDSKEKQVIQGVLTAKIMVKKGGDDNSGCYFEISHKEKVQIWPKQFLSCELGDIIRIEIFSKDVTIKRKVIKRGKI